MRPWLSESILARHGGRVGGSWNETISMRVLSGIGRLREE